MNYLEIRNITKCYGTIVALRNVSFSVKRGEYLCILGPTGAGKTTLLKVIAGLLKPDEGRIYLEGNDITDMPPEERGIVYMPQGYALFPHLTVWENVAYSALTRGLPTKRAEEALKAVGLYHRKDSYPHELSGGQQQRVALARALASGSRILLLDEPLSALDLLLNIQLRYELRRYAKRLGLTVIHVTHNAEEAMSIADRLLILNKGKIEQIGRPEEIYLNPRNIFVASFLSDVAIFKGIVVSRNANHFSVKVKGLGYLLVRGNPPSSKKVSLLIRPEDIKLDLKRQYRINTFRGVLSDIEFEGIKTRLTLNIGTHVIFVDLIFCEPPPLKLGMQVNVYIPPDKILVYEESEKSILEVLAVR
ncbi:MAG: heme ABC exporter ATP-binding protein CcmA [Thermoprotei archaeon]|nr:MAG: heme ABC exporter ATP-binding protein CcmA [Thermoprotei archaeon]